MAGVSFLGVSMKGVSLAGRGDSIMYNEEVYAYGIEFDTTVSNPACTRIGNAALHRTLPVQSAMAGCLLDDDGNVVQYLDPDDWTGETRDGSLGQVMVELPEHYRKFETIGNKRRVWLSTVPIAGYHKVAKRYVSAYKAALDRTNLKLASVVNTDAQYRGGDNQSAWDDLQKTMLGKPATAITLTNFRKYARNRKSGSTEWNAMTYGIQCELYWLFVVEYATLNSQADYTAELTSEGYRQGGLGNGITTLSGSMWNAFSNYYPVIPCGTSDSLGNKSGEVSYTMPSDYGTATIKVNRYRGVESPFGEMWQWTDGILVRAGASTENGGTGLSEVFVSDDPSVFNSESVGNYTYIGNESRSNGYVKTIIFGQSGSIMPTEIGGSNTTYFCDMHSTSVPNSGSILKAVRFGGAASDNTNAGFVYAYSSGDPSVANALIGTRLCFYPH